MVTSSADRTVQIHLLDLEMMAREAQNRVTRELSCEERVSYLNMNDCE